MILYNVELLCDWVANRATPEVHLRRIEGYLVEREKRGERGSAPAKTGRGAFIRTDKQG